LLDVATALSLYFRRSSPNTTAPVFGSADIRTARAPQSCHFSGLDGQGTSVDTSAISYRVADFRISGASGITADEGTIYAADVGTHNEEIRQGQIA
jgi:hypothetical protein